MEKSAWFGWLSSSGKRVYDTILNDLYYKYLHISIKTNKMFFFHIFGVFIPLSKSINYIPLYILSPSLTKRT